MPHPCLSGCIVQSVPPSSLECVPRGAPSPCSFSPHLEFLPRHPLENGQHRRAPTPLGLLLAGLGPGQGGKLQEGRGLPFYVSPLVSAAPRRVSGSGACPRVCAVGVRPAGTGTVLRTLLPVRASHRGACCRDVSGAPHEDAPPPLAGWEMLRSTPCPALSPLWYPHRAL